MRPLLIAEVLGLENVNNGFGFLLVFFGIATFFANPLAGTFVVIQAQTANHNSHE